MSTPTFQHATPALHDFQRNTKLIMIEIYNTQVQLWYTAQQNDCLLIILYPPLGSASI